MRTAAPLLLLHEKQPPITVNLRLPSGRQANQHSFLRMRINLTKTLAATARFAATTLRPNHPGGAVDATNLVWTSGGNAMWVAQPTVTHDGVDGACSLGYPGRSSL